MYIGKQDRLDSSDFMLVTVILQATLRTIDDGGSPKKWIPGSNSDHLDPRAHWVIDHKCRFDERSTWIQNPSLPSPERSTWTLDPPLLFAVYPEIVDLTTTSVSQV